MIPPPIAANIPSYYRLAIELSGPVRIFLLFQTKLKFFLITSVHFVKKRYHTHRDVLILLAPDKKYHGQVMMDLTFCERK